MKKLWIPILLSVLFLSANGQKLEQKSLRQSSYTTDYYLYMPANYDPGEIKDYPLVIFLHGAGERGRDITVVGCHMMFAKEKYWPDYEAIVAVPQCHSDINWEPMVLNQMLREITTCCRVDPDRVYLTGLSMGGYGTWKWAASNPELFAAVAPVCGGGDPDDVWKMRNLPVWAFHGEKDDIVPCSESVMMVEALRKLGAEPKFNTYPEIKHNAWDKAYYMTEFYDWLFSQKRQDPEIQVSDKELDKYVGMYMLEGMDSVEISKANGHLQIHPLKYGKSELKADAPNRFYAPDLGTNMVIFSTSADGKVSGMEVYGNKKPLKGTKIK